MSVLPAYMFTICIPQRSGEGVGLELWRIVSHHLNNKGHLLFFFVFFLELRTEHRALPLLSKCSTTELNPQPKGHLLNFVFKQSPLSIPRCPGIHYIFQADFKLKILPFSFLSTGVTGVCYKNPASQWFLEVVVVPG